MVPSKPMRNKGENNQKSEQKPELNRCAKQAEIVYCDAILEGPR